MLCQVCQKRQVYPGSFWCGIGCRDSRRPGSANYQKVIPRCRICNNDAYYDNNLRSYAQGCCRNHTQEAIQRGFPIHR